MSENALTQNDRECKLYNSPPFGLFDKSCHGHVIKKLFIDGLVISSNGPLSPSVISVAVKMYTTYTVAKKIKIERLQQQL